MENKFLEKESYAIDPLDYEVKFDTRRSIFL